MDKDDDDTKMLKKLEELLDSLVMGGPFKNLAKTILDNASKTIENADAAHESVIAIGCNCKKDHHKNIIIGLHPEVLKHILDAKNSFSVDFSPMGINLTLTIGSGKDYQDCGSKIINFIRERHPDQEFMLSKPTGNKGMVDFGDLVNFGSTDEPRILHHIKDDTPIKMCEVPPNSTKH